MVNLYFKYLKKITNFTDFSVSFKVIALIRKGTIIVRDWNVEITAKENHHLWPGIARKHVTKSANKKDMVEIVVRKIMFSLLS